jgi:hypothetical protein
MEPHKFKHKPAAAVVVAFFEAHIFLHQSIIQRNALQHFVPFGVSVMNFVPKTATG